MARGSISKEKVTSKILSTFPNSFKYDKEIRIPIEENGEIIQIKCVLTAAKVNVENNSDMAIPGEAVLKTTITTSENSISNNFMNEPTAEEKQAVADLVSKLGLG